MKGVFIEKLNKYTVTSPILGGRGHFFVSEYWPDSPQNGLFDVFLRRPHVSVLLISLNT